MVRTVILMACFALVAPTVHAEAFPPDSGLIDIMRLAPGEPARALAKCDGVTDDTQAFRDAIDLCVERKQVILIPVGTCVVTDTINYVRSVDGKAGSTCQIHGVSRDMSVIRLRDGSAGFAAPFLQGTVMTGKPVISMRSAGTAGNQAFQNGMRDLTLDAGNNPGAVGVDFIASNRGELRNVLVKGNGFAGIVADRLDVGPALFIDVMVEGFTRALRVRQTKFALTLERFSMRDQTVMGIDLTGNQAIAIRGLTSVNRVPAIRPNNGLLTIDGAHLMGGDPTRAAIEVANPVHHFYVRDIVADGYRSAIKVGTVFGPSLTIDEQGTSTTRQLFPGAVGSLRLPVEPTPEPLKTPDFSTWCKPIGIVSLQDSIDDSPAIAAGLATPGCRVFYLPHNRPGTVASQYLIGRQHSIPANIERIIFMGGSFAIPAAGYPDGPSAFLVEEDACTPLVIEGMWGTGGFFGGNQTHWFEHRSSRPLVIRSTQAGGSSPGNLVANRGVITRPGAGDLFLEDFNATTVEINGTRLFASQLNLELFPSTLPGVPGIKNNGGRVVVHGLKTEQDFTTIDSNGGAFEIIGVNLLPGVGTGTGSPVSKSYVLRNNARGFFTSMTFSDLRNDNQPIQVEETRDGVTRQLLATEIESQVFPGTRSWCQYRSGGQ